MSNPRAEKKSIYEGVHWSEISNKWRVQVRTGVRGKAKTYYSKSFTNEKDAAKAYLEAKIRLYQEKLKDIS